MTEDRLKELQEIAETQPDPYLMPRNGPVVDELAAFEMEWATNQRGKYLPLRTLRSKTQEGRCLSRWTPTAEQRQMIAEGQDIFLEQLTFGDLLQPARLIVAERMEPESLRAFYDLDRDPATPVPGQPRERMPVTPPDLPVNLCCPSCFIVHQIYGAEVAEACRGCGTLLKPLADVQAALKLVP